MFVHCWKCLTNSVNIPLWFGFNLNIHWLFRKYLCKVCLNPNHNAIFTEFPCPLSNSVPAAWEAWYCMSWGKDVNQAGFTSSLLILCPAFLKHIQPKQHCGAGVAKICIILVERELESGPETRCGFFSYFFSCCRSSFKILQCYNTGLKWLCSELRYF
jgi:hypothetical protein